MLDGIVADLENEEEDELPQPKVTHFNEPMSVTFGGSGGGDSTTRIPNSDGCFSEQQSTKTVSPKRPKDTKIIEELTLNGGKAVDAHSGEIQRMWSQTRDEVIISILVPARICAADLHIKFIPEDTNMVELMGTAKPILSVVLAGKPLLKGKLAYFVQVQEEDDEYDVDWNLEDFDASHRCIKVRT